jgi:uncharacterized delta-60 repeat protein
MNVVDLFRPLSWVVMSWGAIGLAVAQTNLPGTVDQTFNPLPGPTANVRAMAVCPNGKIIIAGELNISDPFLRGGIAKLNTNGTLDADFDVGAGANSHIWAVAAQTNGQVLIAGDFTSFNGTNRGRIARLHSDGSVDPSFDPGVGADATIWSFALQNDGRIVIAGDFLTVHGMSRVHIARLNVDGSLDTTFDPGPGADAIVRVVALQSDGRAIIAGGFNSVGGMIRPRIARLNENGSIDTSFGVSGGASDWIVSLAVQPDDRLIIGGFFTSFAGIPRTRVARLTPNGDLDLAFDAGAGPNEAVTALAIQNDGKIVLGGGFITVDGRQLRRFARLHATGRVDTLFEANPGADSWVETVAIQPDGRILIGGSFTSVNEFGRQRVARLLGGDPPPFAPVIVTAPTAQPVIEGSDVTLQVVARAFPEPSYQWQVNGMNLLGSTRETLVLRNVRLSHAGTYTVIVSNEIGVVESSAMLSITPAPTHPGAADIDFYTGLGSSNVVNAIALHGNRIVTGGGYWLPGGPLFGRVMRLESGGAPDPTFAQAPFAAGSVDTVAVETDGDIITGGSALTGIRRLLSNGTIDSTFDTSSNPADLLHALILQGDGRIVAAGETSRYAILRRFQANGPVDLTFTLLQSDPGAIYSLARQTDGRWLIGGQFDTVTGVSRHGIARIGINGGLDATFDPGSGANSRVMAILQQPDARILLAGQFTRINGVLRNRIARLLPNGALDPSFNPGPSADNNITALSLQPDGRILIGGIFQSVNGVARGGIARLNSDGSLDLGFDTSVGADGPVRAIVALPNGQALVGGAFQQINGVPRPGIARLRGGGPMAAAPAIVAGPTNQTVTSGADVTFMVVAGGTPEPRYQWQLDNVNIPGATNWVFTLANVRTTNSGVYTVVVSNPFGTASAQAMLTVNRSPRHAGAPDISFSVGSGPNDRVQAIALEPSGKIIIGGAFTHVNGQPRGGIARLEHSGAVDSSFDPGSGANGTVYAMARQTDGALVIGGSFTTVDGTPRNGLARLYSNGTLDTNFIGPAGLGTALGTVFAVSLENDGKVLVGGAFGFPRPALVRLETNGAMDFTFTSPFANGAAVYGIDSQQDGRVIAGGYLPAFDGLSQNRLVRLQPDGTRDPSFGSAPAAGGLVYTLSVLDDDRVLFGGNFIALYTNEYNRIGRSTTNGLPDPTFNAGSGANNLVRALALQTNGMAVIGGAFEVFDGRPLVRLARLRANGNVDDTFDVGSGVTEGTFFFDEYGDFIDLTTVNAMAVEDNGRILVGGDFTKINGITRPYLARVYDREALPMVHIRNLTGSMVELTWEFGVLQHATELTGPWRDVTDASSPQQLMRTGSQRFFRLRVDD